jgi:predicted nuclease with TOPRIM domain
MKIKLISIAAILALTTGFTVSAFDTDSTATDVKKSAFKHGHKMKHHHKGKHHIGEIVRDYMLAQGDITQGEIDLQKLERETTRTELKALKKAGDTEGLAVKKTELKAKYDARKAAMQTYIDNHEELQTLIEEKKAELRSKMKEHRENHKGKRDAKKSDDSES